MTVEIAIVFLVIALLVFALFKELLKPLIIFLIANVIFLLTGIIDTKDLLSGFGNEQIAVIFLLLILSDIIKKTSLLDVVVNNIFKQELSYKKFLARMMFSVSGLSAFVNNTPLVAILIPYVYNWAKRKGIAPSKVMLPLSYAAVLGGTITLIGTSTNLLVNSFVVEAGLVPLKFFDFTYIGVPVALFGGLYLIFIGYKLLPSRKDALSDFEESAREYLVETNVPEQSALVGKTVEDACLRNLRGLFLVEIIRQGKLIAPVAPDHVILAGDKLIFAGATDTIVDLINAKNGLVLPGIAGLGEEEKAVAVEVVLASNSSLSGKLVKEADFRSRFDGAIIAIHRDGERLSGKIGEVVLKSGDLLLVLAGKHFKDRAGETRDLHIISKIKEIVTIDRKKMYFLGLVLFAGITLAASGIISLFVALLSVIGIIAFGKIVKLNDIKNSIDFNLIAILALSLSLGKAIFNSGAGTLLADGIIDLAAPFNSTIAVLLGVYLITNMLTMVVSNSAAVAITFPVAYAATRELGIIDPTPFFLAVAFAGSAEFMTPFGYQTNLMVFGPGGYKFKDYMKVGSVLTLLYMITCIAILSYMYKLN